MNEQLKNVFAEILEIKQSKLTALTEIRNSVLHLLDREEKEIKLITNYAKQFIHDKNSDNA